MTQSFDRRTGHLTDPALLWLLAAEQPEGSAQDPEQLLTRLEAAEHLAYCDHCLERYTALLEDAPLLEAPELLAPGVLRAFDKKQWKSTGERAFKVGLSACIALVLWVSGVFSVPSAYSWQNRPNTPPPAADPPFSLSQAAGGALGGWASSLSDFLYSIDLRGVFRYEKK